MIDYEICIEAPARTVFAMLTDPDLLTAWMAVDAQVDRRPGGSFRWLYENGDVVLGRFIEIDEPHRLVLSYGWEKPASRGIPPASTEVEILLNETDAVTRLRLIHRGLPPSEVDSHRHGWTFFLGRLAAHLAQTTGAPHEQ